MELLLPVEDILPLDQEPPLQHETVCQFMPNLDHLVGYENSCKLALFLLRRNASIISIVWFFCMWIIFGPLSLVPVSI